MKKKFEIIVILDNIRSVHNVASIFRTADGAGINKIYLCGITPSPLDRFNKILPQFSKVSLGAEKYVAWEKHKSALILIKKLKNPLTGGGYKILAIEQSQNSIPYNRLMVKGQISKVVLIFGNEVRGLSSKVLKIADKILEIPMFGKKESLNVSVAFGIIVYRLATTFYNKHKSSVISHRS